MEHVKEQWYRCRWDRSLKDGEEVKWWEAYGCLTMHEAAEAFARFTDTGNPRPPAVRTVLVALPTGGTRSIEVRVKPSLAYECDAM